MADSAGTQVGVGRQLASADTGEEAEDAGDHRPGQPDGAPALGDDDETRGFHGTGSSRRGVKKGAAMS